MTSVAKASDYINTAASGITEVIETRSPEVSETRQNVDDDDKTFLITRRCV